MNLYSPRTKEELRDLLFKKQVPAADIDTRFITDMSGLFDGKVFDGDISGWDVTQDTNMRKML